MEHRRLRGAIVALLVICLALVVGLGFWLARPEPVMVQVAAPARPAPLVPDGPLLARAEAPATGPFDVACPMVSWGPRTPEHIAVFLFTDEASDETTWVAGTVDEAWLQFEAPTAEGAGLVTIRGHERASVVWWPLEDGTTECHFPDIPVPLRTVQRRITAPDDLGDDLVSLELCDQPRPGSRTCTSHELHSFIPERTFWTEARDRLFLVCRRTGDLRRCEEIEGLQIDGEGDLEVPWLPPVAGTGATLERTPEGMIVREVQADSPADRAGLEPGARIDDVQTEATATHKWIAIGEEDDQAEVWWTTPDGEERHAVLPLAVLD